MLGSGTARYAFLNWTPRNPRERRPELFCSIGVEAFMEIDGPAESLLVDVEARAKP